MLLHAPRHQTQSPPSETPTSTRRWIMARDESFETASTASTGSSVEMDDREAHTPSFRVCTAELAELQTSPDAPVAAISSPTADAGATGSSPPPPSLSSEEMVAPMVVLSHGLEVPSGSSTNNSGISMNHTNSSGIDLHNCVVSWPAIPDGMFSSIDGSASTHGNSQGREARGLRDEDEEQQRRATTSTTPATMIPLLPSSAAVAAVPPGDHRTPHVRGSSFRHPRMEAATASPVFSAEVVVEQVPRTSAKLPFARSRHSFSTSTNTTASPLNPITEPLPPMISRMSPTSSSANHNHQSNNNNTVVVVQPRTPEKRGTMRIEMASPRLSPVTPVNFECDQHWSTDDDDDDDDDDDEGSCSTQGRGPHHAITATLVATLPVGNDSSLVQTPQVVDAPQRYYYAEEVNEDDSTDSEYNAAMEDSASVISSEAIHVRLKMGPSPLPSGAIRGDCRSCGCTESSPSAPREASQFEMLHDICVEAVDGRGFVLQPPSSPSSMNTSNNEAAASLGDSPSPAGPPLRRRSAPASAEELLEAALSQKWAFMVESCRTRVSLLAVWWAPELRHAPAAPPSPAEGGRFVRASSMVVANASPRPTMAASPLMQAGTSCRCIINTTSILFALTLGLPQGGADSVVAAFMQMELNMHHQRGMEEVGYNVLHTRLVAMPATRMLESHQRLLLCIERDLFMRRQIELFHLLHPSRRGTGGTAPTARRSSTSSGGGIWQRLREQLSVVSDQLPNPRRFPAMEEKIQTYSSARSQPLKTEQLIKPSSGAATARVRGRRQSAPLADAHGDGLMPRVVEPNVRSSTDYFSTDPSDSSYRNHQPRGSLSSAGSRRKYAAEDGDVLHQRLHLPKIEDARRTASARTRLHSTEREFASFRVRTPPRAPTTSDFSSVASL